MFLDELFFVVWFFLPAGVANMTPIFAANIPCLKGFNYPLDCYTSWNGKRILGDNKTIRGLVTGILTSIFIVLLQQNITINNPFVQHLTLDLNDAILLGFLMGFGALGGDAVKSFLKRQYNILPGKQWIPFDQLDYVFGGIVTTFFLVPLTFFQYILLIFVWFTIHIIATRIGFMLGLKSAPL